MNAPNTLRQQWEQALTFRIGEDNSLHPTQLPWPLNFPKALRENLSPDDAASLGYVLFLGVLKLYHPDGASDLQENIFDDFGRVGDGFLSEVAPDERGVAGLRAVIWYAFLNNLGRYLTLAARSPEHLAQFHRLLGSLDNEALHQMAMQAVSGQEVADLFHIGNY